MSLLWKDDLFVDASEVEKQHRIIVALIAQLLSASSADFSGVYSQFELQLAEHFDNEESLMKQNGLPDFKSHRDDHLRFLDEVKEIRRYYERGGTSRIRYFLHHRIPEWFEAHARTMDRNILYFSKPRSMD
jgi:hemerythrin